MKDKFFGFKTTIVLLIVIAISVIMATFIESATSTENARDLVYNATWFEVMLALLTLNITGSLFYHKSFQWSKITVPLFHLSFVLIMIGAMFTRYTGVEGMISIREGQQSNVVRLENNGGDKILPFEVFLNDFELKRYPGSNSPSSYSSVVTVQDEEKGNFFEYHIYMNHILKYRGWRFFQTSYDQDEKGTVLTATRDVIGTPVTYFGYFLTITTLFLSLLLPGTFFRKQLRKLRTMGITVLLLFVSIIGFSAPEIDAAKIVDVQQAQEFGELVVQDYKGKMKTMNTLDNEFMRKLYGAETIDAITADQVVLSLQTYPEEWVNVPLIKVHNKDVRKSLDMEGKYLSYANLFNPEGRYILSEPISRIFMKPESSRNKFDKAMIKLDDKANILHAFIIGDAITVFPIENIENNKWHASKDAAQFSTNSEDSLFLKHIFPLYIDALQEGKTNGNYDQAANYLSAIKKYQEKAGAEVTISPSKIKAELNYNKWHIFERMEKMFALVGFVLLILFFIILLKGKVFPRWLEISFQLVALILLIITEIGVGLRWYIGGYVPLSNSLEVMIFLSGIVLLAGLIISRRQPVTLALSLILGYTFLFVASMNNGNPEIGNLVPVLKSYWLSIHVAVITSSYALFALVMMMALVNLMLFLFLTPLKFKRIVAKSAQLDALIQVMLTIALYMLTIGTILGAIWANESWGRYWGWDAKETWALISIFIYAFVAHMRFIPAMKDQYWVNLAAFWSFTSILMTFFGVNYFLVGLHSYAGVGEANSLPMWIWYTAAVFVIITALSGIRYFKVKEKLEV
ncbi:MAG: cytochrome c biogenesis protein CcsA [Prolixibacteraceae bacterium]|jgi:cytochrome c-type biogenesis protein CcsB|nr:cytochrome c biogenesis protein CcsA [Prolixibacteraceae bacterium]